MRDVRLLVLVSMSDRPRHGYAIQQDVEQFAGIRLGPGTLYGALGGLERDGLIEELSSGGRRRPYRLTTAGRRALDERLAALHRITARAASGGVS